MLLIDHYRAARALSYADLEKASGIDRGTLWRYANGKREPGVGSAYLIAKALGVGLDELYVHDAPSTTPANGHGVVPETTRPHSLSAKS